MIHRFFACILFSIFFLRCADTQSDNSSNKTDGNVVRDINIVLDSHSKEIMSIEGVAGVYVGALDDGTSCICIMVVKLTLELQKKLPKELEGYPVRIEETGEIKPLEG